MIKALFKSKKPEEQAKFDHTKISRKDSNEKPFPPLKTLRIPLKFFDKDEDVEEDIDVESEDDIV